MSIESKQSLEPQREKTFDFTAEDVIKTLQAKGGTKLEYMGTATSHFQAEPLLYGSDGKPIITSDWELELAKNLRGEPSKIKAGQREREFPTFLAKKDQYIRRSEELGQNMFRFSLDFARLCSREGEFNEPLMAEYVRALALIRAHGQEPMLTIHHWPMPTYLLENDEKGNITKGGWENPDVARHFRFYVEHVIEFLGNEDKVRRALQQEGFDAETQDKFLAEGLARYFISINEPMVITGNGYLSGVFPPYKKRRIDLIKKVTARLVEAHDLARDQIKKGALPHSRGAPQVGVAHAWPYFDGVLGTIAHDLYNQRTTDKFERGGEYTDFLGLQYYFRTTIPQFKKGDRVYGEHPGFGDVYPPGIYEVLKKMNNRYPQKEIFITEFGFSDKQDLRRPYWILETVRYVIEALKSDIPVKGMLLWSLVNNFEWEHGMEQKFGLFDERELNKPSTSSGHEVRGAQAWQAVSKALLQPTPENLLQLQTYYEKAKQQFENVSS